MGAAKVSATSTHNPWLHAPQTSQREHRSLNTGTSSYGTGISDHSAAAREEGANPP
jgi:hypothetical protein